MPDHGCFPSQSDDTLSSRAGRKILATFCPPGNSHASHWHSPFVGQFVDSFWKDICASTRRGKTIANKLARAWMVASSLAPRRCHSVPRITTRGCSGWGREDIGPRASEKVEERGSSLLKVNWTRRFPQVLFG